MEKNQAEIEKYIPYGEEWVKELMKWPKKKLIDEFIKRVIANNNKLGEQLTAANAEIERLKADNCELNLIREALHGRVKELEMDIKALNTAGLQLVAAKQQIASDACDASFLWAIGRFDSKGWKEYKEQYLKSLK